LSNPRAFCQSPRRKIVTNPMTRATPKARYDQITVLGMLKKAMAADKFSKLPLMTIPFLSRLTPISCPGDVIKCHKGRCLVAGGGTLANLIFGALFWVAAHAVKRSASWRYFLWLLMTFNLFSVGGYFLFPGIGNIGDWAAVVAGWQPAWTWRVGLAALGIVTYFFVFVPLSLRELRPFLGKDAKIRVRRARQLTVTSALSHCRGPRLRCGRAESGGAAVDSDLRCSCVIWWQLRAGMDVEPAPWPALPQQ
jgi:hypothetical protein